MFKLIIGLLGILGGIVAIVYETSQPVANGYLGLGMGVVIFIIGGISLDSYIKEQKKNK